MKEEKTIYLMRMIMKSLEEMMKNLSSKSLRNLKHFRIKRLIIAGECLKQTKRKQTKRA